MNKLILLGIAASLGAAKLALAPQGTPVNLQPTSPGTEQTGHLNISGTATVGLLKSQGTVFGQATSPTGISYGGFFTAASNQARGFYGYASSPTGLTYGGFFQNASDQGRAVYGLNTATSGTTFGGYFQSASPSGRGLFGVATANTGLNYGVYGRSFSSQGYGVFSEGNLGSTADGTFAGRVGAGNMNPQAPLHVVGTSWFTGDSTPLPVGAGSGVAIGYGGTGYLFAFDYAAFVPKHLSLQGPGGNVGIGTTNPAAARLVVEGGGGNGVHVTSSNGIGVRSVSTNSYGAYVQSQASIAMYAVSSTYAGSLSSGGYIGVQGNATGSDVNRQGVRGDNSGSSTGYAGLFNGNTWVFGTLTKSAGAFRIDHPLDPENKYLTHSFVESPDMKNIYDGVVVTNQQGVALVKMPEWFESLNKDFRYQLTVIGQFAQAIVAREIENNQFVIRTDKPDVKVSWQVTGIRHDPYAEKNRIEVETDKPANFRGKFIYPEGYDEPRSKSIGDSIGVVPAASLKGVRPIDLQRLPPAPNRR